MDTLVQRYSSSLNKLAYNHHSITGLPVQNHVNPYQPIQPFQSNESIQVDSSLSSGLSSEIKEISSEISSEMIDMSRIRDNYGGVLEYIDQVLMGEDVQKTPCMFHQCSALQAAEKSFYDVLGEKYPPPPSEYLIPDCSDKSSSNSQNCSNSFLYVVDDSIDKSSSSQNSSNSFSESNRIYDRGESESFLHQSTLVNQSFEQNFQVFHPSVNSSEIQFPGFISSYDGLFVSQTKGEQEKVNHIISNDYYLHRLELSEEDFKGKVIENHLLNSSRDKRIRYREDNENQLEEQSRKQLASWEEEFEQTDIYGDEVFCEEFMCSMAPTKLQLHRGQSKETKARRIRGNRQGNKRELIDLRSLLTQCAQAVQSSDVKNAGEILKRIRQHSSPNGDGTERLAHYFANAIEARLAGTGIELYTDFNRKRITAFDILKAYQAYVKACPFHRMSNILANKSILRLAKGTTRLHIIDFGILYGFQWPCFIQGLSRREGGPPKLRITGIDFPQPGFRPTERVEASGNHLARYCKKFNVPFEYNAIAKNWDTIKLEDLKIEKDEMLVVNCLYRLRNVPDETADETSPRDTVLDLIKRINPDMFVHGVLNGTYNAPFFVTRFREATFHFSSLFDMFEATELRKDKHRLLFEQEVFGRDAMNVIACEGTARIERPETYKQWQYRNLKAGFRQLPLHKDIMKEVSAKVRLNYHKEFLVDEERNWMLQGWKGRVLYALSFWKPA